MADHFYSLPNAATTLRRMRNDVVVGTSLTGANPIELRVTDGALTARNVADFCDYMRDLFMARDFQVIPAGTVK